MKYIYFRYVAVVLIMLGAVTLFAQTKQEMEQTKTKNVEITTTKGVIVVKLYDETPKHRDNFLKLVNEAYYDSVLFHRVIKNFMIQTGDGDSKTAGPDAVLGSGDPGYTVEAEFVYPKYFHKRGALAAARTADQVNPERRSSGSQFYIVTGKVYSMNELKQMEAQKAEEDKMNIFQKYVQENRDSIMLMQSRQDQAGLMDLQNDLIAKTEAEYAQHPFKFTNAQYEAYTTVGGTPFLDNSYTVFGEVVSGMDVVSAIEESATGANDRPVEDIRILKVTVLP